MNESLDNFSFAKHYNKKLKEIKKADKINNLDDLRTGLEKVVRGWRGIKRDEQDLRNQELLIHEAFLSLKPDQNWKNSNCDLFVDYLSVGDDEKLIKLIQSEFNLQQVSTSKEAIFQVGDEINRREIATGQETLADLPESVDNEDIIKKRAMPYNN